MKEKSNKTTLFKIAIFISASISLFSAGCDSLRFAPTEAQKQNAWLHNRTAIVTAETARAEDTSPKLQALTQLGEVQSRAFSTYYGLPKQFPQAKTAEEILTESNLQLTNTALQQSAERPDPWEAADAMLQMGIGICSVLGGVYGTKAVRFLKDAKGKSNALKEIIAGNELFKKQNQAQSDAFKQAHQNQSAPTRQLVAAMKA
jgi:hypothetical protein